MSLAVDIVMSRQELRAMLARLRAAVEGLEAQVGEDGGAVHRAWSELRVGLILPIAAEAARLASLESAARMVAASDRVQSQLDRYGPVVGVVGHLGTVVPVLDGKSRAAGAALEA